jgi:hypothetical protein
MENLIYHFTQLDVAPVQWYNHTNHDLHYVTDGVEDHVYTKNPIAAGEFIGTIDGIECSIAEILPDKYCIMLDDETVLDCRSTPRCITAMIREGWFDGLNANCRLAFTYTSLQTLVYVEAAVDIAAGEELIMYKMYI